MGLLKNTFTAAMILFAPIFVLVATAPVHAASTHHARKKVVKAKTTKATVKTPAKKPVTKSAKPVVNPDSVFTDEGEPITTPAKTAKTRTPTENPKAKVPKGSLSIVSEPPGAELIFNSEKKGRTPIVVKLTKKSNRIVLRLKGYRNYDAMIEKKTLTRELTVGLTPESASSMPAPSAPPPTHVERPQEKPQVSKPAPPGAARVKPLPDFPAVPDSLLHIPEPLPQPAALEPGTLFVSSSPSGASLTLDGQPTGAKTPLKLELAPGSHHFEMEHGGLKGSIDYQINPGKNKALLLQLQ